MLSLLAGLVLFTSSLVLAQTNDAAPTGAIAGNYSGNYRPQIHFSPPEGFMNDPNGMFQDANATWHLYYQYNPTDTIAGNQHWGHATSDDLYHWTNQPIALAPYDNVTGIFTGSAVIDVNNTSGLFPNQTNGVVAMYTANGPDDQNQAIAYSYDDGYTWEYYADNPVIAIGSTQFRDPKVIWHAPTQRWVMVLAYAQEFTIGIYTSPNLLNWTHASNFSHAGLLGLQYECPNLVELPYVPADGSSSSPIWLLYISINPGAPLGGSIGQYFPGAFNGTHFRPVDGVARIADFGKDNYATQFFYRSGENGSEDGVSVAWASNWQYTNFVPTGPAEGWQSAMTLPRRNWVQRAEAARGDYVLMSYPYELGAVQGRVLAQNGSVGNGTVSASGGATGPLMVQANVTGLNLTGIASTASLNITVRSSGSGESLSAGQVFGGDPAFWMDRGNTTAFENVFFTNRVSVGLVLEDAWEMLMVVDRSVWEVFLMSGQKSATQTFFASGLLDEVEVSVDGLNEAANISVAVWELESAWASGADDEGIVQGNTTSTGSQQVKRSGVQNNFWA
jgi:beta-fructofuranosidase